MWCSFSFSILAAILIVVVENCDILVNIHPQTYSKVYVQINFYNDTKSPVYTFDGDERIETIRLKSDGWTSCGLKPTQFQVFNDYPGPGVAAKANSTAYLDGYGIVNYIVLADGIFQGARAGVSCSVGDCGASRG